LGSKSKRNYLGLVGTSLLVIACATPFLPALVPKKLKVLSRRKRSCEITLVIESSSSEGLKINVHIPTWLMKMEQNESVANMELRNFFSNLVVERLEKDLSVCAKIECELAQMSIQSLLCNNHPKGGGGGSEVANVILDDFLCSGNVKLSKQGSVEIEVNSFLDSFALHSQQPNTRCSHHNEDRCGTDIEVELLNDYAKLALSFKAGFLFVGTDSLAVLLGFFQSTTEGPEVEVAELGAAEEETLKSVQNAPCSNQLTVGCKQIEINLGKTGAKPELYFVLWVNSNLQYYEETSTQYLGIERSSLFLKSKRLVRKGATHESYIIRPTSFSCQTKLGSNEGGLDLTPFSVLLSFDELNEVLSMCKDDKWATASAEPPPNKESQISTTTITTMEPERESVSSPSAADKVTSQGGQEKKRMEDSLKSPAPVLSPNHKEVVSLRCLINLQEVFFSVDLGKCAPCVSHLPPNYAICGETCSLFTVHRIRGTKYFKLALYNRDWKGFYLSKSERNDHDIVIRSLPSKDSSYHFQFYTKQDKSSGKMYLCCRHHNSILNMSERGVFCFHKDCVTDIGIVPMNTTRIPRLNTFQLTFPAIQIHLYISKTSLDDIYVASEDQKEDEPLLTEANDQELCRLILNIRKLSYSKSKSKSVTNCCSEMDLVLLIRDSEESLSLTRAFSLSRLHLSYLSKESVSGHEYFSSAFFWDAIDIEMSEMAVECICIALQGLSMLDYFPVQQMKKVQNEVCSGNLHLARKKDVKEVPRAKDLPSNQVILDTVTLGCFHIAEIHFKIKSLVVQPICDVLVGRVISCSTTTSSITSGRFLSSSATNVNMKRFDIDSYHPSVESAVCLRTKSSLSKSLLLKAMAPELAFLSVSFGVEQRDVQKDISAHFRLSPIELNIHEEVIFQLAATLLPYRNFKPSEMGRERADSRKRQVAAKKIQRWFRNLKRKEKKKDKEKLRRSNSAKKIQRWWRKKNQSMAPSKDSGSKINDPSSKYHIKVFDIHPLQISTEYKSARADSVADRDTDSVLSDFSTLLDVLGAPAVGTVNIRCKRILLHDVDMSKKELLKTFTQNFLKYALLAVAEETVEHNIPWLDTAVNEYFALETVNIRNAEGEKIQRQEKRRKRRNVLTRVAAFVVSTPRRLIWSPLAFVVKSGATSIKHAGWTFLISAASDMTDSALKGAETMGLRGVSNAVVISSVRMITTPPKQAVFRLWASRSALTTSDLTATFKLSDAVGMNDLYLEAYIQGIIDHVFQLRNCQVSIKDSEELVLQNLPIMESEREELIDFIEHILQSEGLLEENADSNSFGSKGGGRGGINHTSTFSAKIRHLSQKRKDPRKQLLRIASSFGQNLAIVLVSQKLRTVLPFHRYVDGSLNKYKSSTGKVVVRTVFSSLFIFGYRRLSWMIPSPFAKKVLHTYLVSLAFQKSSSDTDKAQNNKQRGKEEEEEPVVVK
jgi:hypothetical protein